MFTKILIGLAVVIIILVVVIATRPPGFKVERSATINAPPATVFGQVNDFHKWEAWSPWEKMDPAMKKTIEGPPSGTGAKYHWVGNDKVGEGQMEITDSKPAELVKIKLDFIKPMASTSDTLFTFTPEGSGTKVTWTMSGKNNFMAKAFSLVMNMDKMVGGDFEKGLAQMKAVSEAPAKP
jgi:uncharacterized protein YndB with AHSA1/START domain